MRKSTFAKIITYPSGSHLITFVYESVFCIKMHFITILPSVNISWDLLGTLRSISALWSPCCKSLSVRIVHTTLHTDQKRRDGLLFLHCYGVMRAFCEKQLQTWKLWRWGSQTLWIWRLKWRYSLKDLSVLLMYAIESTRRYEHWRRCSHESFQGTYSLEKRDCASRPVAKTAACSHYLGRRRNSVR